MPSFTMTKHIAAPVDIVFDVATDIEHAAEHIRGIDNIERLTPAPIGVGTKWRETRTMMGRQDCETLEIIAFDRPHSYTIGCDSCGAHLKSTFRFTPTGNETDVTLEVDLEARSTFARLMAPIGRMMFNATMRKCLEADLEDIKNAAESRTSEAATT